MEKSFKIGKSEIKITATSDLKYEIQELSFVNLTVTGDEDCGRKAKVKLILSSVIRCIKCPERR